MAIGRQENDATQTRLWEAIEARRIGMLGLTKSGLHAQPMIAFVERRRKRLWFIARNDTDLVRSVGDGGSGDFIFQDGELMASISGALNVVEDRRRMPATGTPRSRPGCRRACTTRGSSCCAWTASTPRCGFPAWA